MTQITILLGLLALTKQQWVWGGNECNYDSDCIAGYCCSEWGYCGQGHEYCGVIDLLEGGACYSQQNCYDHEYCSEWGYCQAIGWDPIPERYQAPQGDLQAGQCHTSADCYGTDCKIIQKKGALTGDGAKDGEIEFIVIISYIYFNNTKMIQIYQDRVSSSSFKWNTMVLMDDDNYESSCTEKINTDKNSNQSLNVCKRRYSSSIFEDSDDNQSAEVFTNRITLDLNCNEIEEEVVLPARKKKKNISKINFESLALRNIKTNFASGLIQFLQFKQELMIEENNPKQEQLELIIQFMFLKLPVLRSFSGWREIWKDSTFGYKIRKLSILFFSKFYIYVYIQSSRVKQEYKKQYMKKIPKFIQGAQKYRIFNSYNFNL